MTPKQREKLKEKIFYVKRTLAAVKRKFGAYDDSGGLRYMPAKYFIQLGDYEGGLTYLKWFDRNFPDDIGFPDFLLEWTIILFKCGKTREAKKKVFDTFCSNVYLFDKFFGRPITPIDKWEGSNIADAAYTEYLDYSSQQVEFAGFSEWLNTIISTEGFKSCCDKYIEIYKQLKNERDTSKRRHLIMEANQLKESV